MNKKKIILIIGIIAFIGALVAVSLIYNKNAGNQEELLNNAADVGIIRVNDANFETEMTEKNKIIVLEFYENMCPPCTSMIPTIIKIAKMSDDVKVGMVNISESDTTSLAAKYEVSATPTIVILKNNTEIKKFIGATGEEAIMDVINRQLAIIEESKEKEEASSDKETEKDTNKTDKTTKTEKNTKKGTKNEK